MIINNNNEIIFTASQSRDGSDRSGGINLELHEFKEITHAKNGNTDKLKEQERAEALIDKFMDRTISLEVDNELHRVIIKLVDRRSGEIIREIPPEELIELAKKMRSAEGIFLDKEV